MLKLLTLNTHCWLEIHQIPKIYELAQFIVRERIDVVALQEVNQFVHSPVVDAVVGFTGGNGVPVRQDNFALLLNQFLAQLDAPYYWGWAEAHIGFERYDEGVAVLTRAPHQRIELVDLSPAYSYDEVARRVALAVQLSEEFGGAWVASAHMSWWKLRETKLFEGEFRQLDTQMRELAQGAPVILAGDFNNAAEVAGEGYGLMTGELGWLDTYHTAELVEGEFTVHKAIHGWDNLTQALRIDLVLTDRPLSVLSHRVVFPDTEETAISDHSGLYLTIDL